MQTKLTLRIDDKVIAKAKRIAKLRNQSLSSIVEDHFRKMGTLNDKRETELIPDWIQKLGVKNWKEKKVRNDARLEYLLDKHVRR